jgi:type IV pilus assembly protein PilB
MKDLFEKLVNSWKAMDSELDQIKSLQRQSTSKIASYLSRHNEIGNGDVLEFLCHQFKIDRYTPEEYPQREDLKSVIPMDLALKYHLVPLKKRRNLVWVGTCDPTNLENMDIIERLTSLELEPVFCSKSELETAFGKCYHVASDYHNIFSLILEADVKGQEEATRPSRPVEILSTAPSEDETDAEPVARLLSHLLVQASREKASHIHISPQKNDIQILFRVDGLLREMILPSKGPLLSMLAKLKLLANMDISMRRIPQEGMFSFLIDQQSRESIDVKVTTVPTLHGENMVMELFTRLPGEHDLDSLGLSEENKKKIEHAIAKQHGLILISGPRDSGKTTLAYSLLRRMNRPDIKIFTLEETIACQIDSISQVQFNPRGELSMAEVLRAVVGQNPDVVMVGEIRDEEVASILARTALSGRKALGSMYANCAAGVVSELVGMKLDPYLISSTLLVSINQRFVRRNCPHCAEPYSPSMDLLDTFKADFPAEVVFMRGRGCSECNDLGFLGRMGVHEVLWFDETIREMILRKANFLEITRTAIEMQSFHPLAADAINKVSLGITPLEEACSLITG